MELIPNKEDREFTTSIGHWTGDGEWDAGPVGGKTGLQKVTLPDDLSTKTITLEYPYIKPEPGVDNALNFNLTTKDALGVALHYIFTLTDGNYSYYLEDDFHYEQGVWVPMGDVWTLPEDWDKTNSTLTVTLNQLEERESDMVFDDFSTSGEIPRGDYLPLMGVH